MGYYCDNQNWLVDLLEAFISDNSVRHVCSIVPFIGGGESVRVLGVSLSVDGLATWNILAKAGLGATMSIVVGNNSCPRALAWHDAIESTPTTGGDHCIHASVHRCPRRTTRQKYASLDVGERSRPEMAVAS